MKKLVRITTIPLSLEKLLEDQARFFKAHYQITLVSAHPERLKAVADAQGVQYHSIPLTRKITPLQDLWCLIQMYRFLKREHPLIVHTHTPKAGIIGMLAAYLARVPIRLHTIAGLPLMETHGLKRKILLFVERLTYRCATKIYPNSFGLKKFIAEEKLAPPEKLAVIGQGSSNGIDTDYFSKKQISSQTQKTIKENFAIPASDFVFIFIGRLVGDKGINELVEAFVQLQQEVPEARLLLVGPQEADLDPLHDHTLQTIKQHPQITTTGYQSDVRPLLALSHVFVFPSYREGFPNVVLQAAAMEVPCIVSDINGCNEIIQDQVNGGIVPPKQVLPLIEKMKYFYTHLDRLNEFAQKTKERIYQHYDRKQFWSLLLNEYHQQEKNVSDHKTQP
ncbi:MAG: glycosyltransferase family 4 protein [Flavobacteriaceae bacterium]